MILAGDLPAGERVAELKLVDAVGVSRTPLRLAMEHLAHEGLLARRAKGGFVVREFTLDEVRKAIELRGVLEGLACRFAAESRPDPAKLDALFDTLMGIDAALETATPSMPAFVEYVELNERFHEQLLDLAHSELLARQLHQVHSLPFASPSAFVRHQARSVESHRILIVAQEQHRTMAEAVASGDGGRGESVAREHARLAMRNLDAAARDVEALRRLPGGALLRFGR
jgi:GntR family transcriptional regulator of vanillate catabolism